jgi:methionyl aminopeptidase
MLSIIIKTEEEIEKITEAGKRLAKILDTVKAHAKAGVSALELDTLAEKLIRDGGDEPAFKGYKPDLHKKPYPASLIVSINDQVVHGIPKAETILKDGDIVSLDLGLKHQGCFADHAITIAIGEITPREKKLLQVTRDALYAGIDMAKPGNRIGDIGATIQAFAMKNNFGIVHDLAGHGVGRYIHEDPYIPNYGKPHTGAVIKVGMTLAIEPMFNLGTAEVKLMPDGYTFVTADGKKSAHFEHTILITHDGPVILTEVE